MDEKTNDDFWDIDYIRPKKKPRPFSRDTGTIRLDFENSSAADNAPGHGDIPPAGRITPAKNPPLRKLTLDELKNVGIVVPGSVINPPPAEPVPAQDDEPTITAPAIGAAIPSREELARRNEPYLRYTPADNRLLNEVRVCMWPTPFTIYERFRSDARRYYNHPARECEPAPFFSFMPQYAQLNAVQRAWYFWWRSLAREGKYLPTDFGYVYLYIYELINLSDTLDASAVLNSMVDVWLGCRAQHPRLDRYLSEWVCDLCLIHNLPLPYERLKVIYPQITAIARFKEFYAGCDKGEESPFAKALFDFNSGYDWRQSKYITDANRELFEKHIRGAFMFACRELEHAPDTSGTDVPDGAQTQNTQTQNAHDDLLTSALRSYGSKLRVIRDAYSGALCSYEIKRRIEVDYSSCTRSPELRFIVTDMVKYAENNVRAMIGVKSRFNTPNLPPPARVHIYNYFAPYRVKPDKKTAEKPEYEKQYEAASMSLSPEAALELERRSWETTDRLVNAFTDAEDVVSDVPPVTRQTDDNVPDTAAMQNDAPLITPPDTDPGLAICARAYRFIRAGDAHGFAALADEYNIMPETLAENLNEYAYEIVGDIAAEPDGTGWRIVDDYAAELDDYFDEVK